MWAVRPSRSRTSASQWRGAAGTPLVDAGHVRESIRRTGTLARRPACPAVNGRAAPGRMRRMARRTTKNPVPDDFEEHILDIDIGDEMRVVVPGVRLLGHLLPRAARRPRRAQAGAAPDPLHDERHGPAPRPRPREERPRRRRGDGPAAPARRRRDLRRPGADGPAVVDAAADDRRARQLRLARRLPRRDALHRVPDGAAGGGDDRLDRRGHRRLQAQLRQPRARADRAAGGDPQPDRQRHHRHRGRHGHQHRPAQPGRGRAGAAAPDHAPRRRRSTT